VYEYKVQINMVIVVPDMVISHCKMERWDNDLKYFVIF